MSGSSIMYFITFYTPALIIGLIYKMWKPQYGWTPLWICVIITVAAFFIRNLFFS